MSPSVEHLDVAIIGAGLSGIGAAHRLRTECPGKTFALFEARGAIGGTWDLFRYPGIRSDSDMFTLGYPWRPWAGRDAIADGSSILSYLQDTAGDAGLTPHIRFNTRLVSADFSSTTSRWTLQLETDDDGGDPQRRTVTCSFLYACTGYYNYTKGYQPDFAGLEDFAGEVIHPQFWPEGLDYAGKQVVVIGSGATAVSLIPSLVDEAAHVTMLQRSPSYIVSVPRRDRIADAARKVLPAGPAHRVARARNVVCPLAFYQLCMRMPRVAMAYLRSQARGILKDEQQIREHFMPAYNPWEQRLCVAPGGDFYRSLTSGKASVVTERIDRFTPGGIRLESGRELAADVVVSATGLALQSLGGAQLSIDGVAVDLSDAWVHQGVLVTGIPNLGYCVGYTNASWTLRSDLSSRFVCRLLKHMDRKGYTVATPVPEAGISRRPLLDLSSGYVQRAGDVFHRQGSGRPWTVGVNYLLDTPAVLLGKVSKHMAFDSDPGQGTTRNRKKVA
ncbi:NAD(P)/FAD-dependent oxidoreductase [Arthrobacter sp. CAN_C5]|uniref:flavin-containing monooxygenase n=1 Tax=Arthrobacter sp. CAN_C5 TaxID=2760706 RepID=UPI001AEAD691|nr:NAD(P)/FAD-dependent oxidoreductase [Arthrobacter sp. CAN_C5]MBP2218088.1 cation diffusion facilitator CzcD-associated flavoprotein CzcO [Arthrobacter sp. CAN_C5]